MLNTTHKIASSCIAARLKMVLPKLISEEQQKGFLKGRHIGKNIRLLYTNKHQVPGRRPGTWCLLVYNNLIFWWWILKRHGHLLKSFEQI